MYQTQITSRNRHVTRQNRRKKQRKPSDGRRLAVESLEPRQMLSGTPISTTGLTFQVVDDATTNISYRYAMNGSVQGSTTLAAANAAPRGATSVASIDKTWVIDANRNVYVYSTAGTLLGSWSAGSLASNATPEGIATDGNDIWIVDSKSDKVFRYTGAANRLSGSQAAASSFNLNSSNTNPKDIVTDGVALWTVDDGAKTDKVFKYLLPGSLVGSWTIDAANKAPTGITFDPMNVHDLWITDSGTDRVYEYDGTATRNAGSQAATASFALATNNQNAQGIALVHGPMAETPYDIAWIRQFGSAGDDHPRGGTVDTSGNAYMSGQTTGSLAVPNPGGDMTPFLAKYGTDGTALWVDQQSPISGTGYSGLGAAADGLGNVFQVTSLGTLTTHSSGGALQSSIPLPSGEAFFSVASDDAGYAYMESYVGSTVHVRKMEAQTGNIVWDSTLDVGSPYENSSGISWDPLGNVYVVGYTYGSSIGPNAGLADGFVAKYDTNGHLQWTRQFGTAGYDFAYGIYADALGNVYTSGGYYATQEDWNAGNQDVFLTKFDASGNQQWTRLLATTANDQPSGPFTDNAGNVYITGATQGALGGSNQGAFDIVTAKYDSAGKMLWIQQFGTAGNDVGGANKIDASGNLIVFGRTTASWGGPNAGGEDAVLIKLTPPAMLGAASLASELQAPIALKVSTLNLASTASDGTSAPTESTNSHCQTKSTATNMSDATARYALLAQLEAVSHRARHLDHAFTDELATGWHAKNSLGDCDLSGVSCKDHFAAADLAIEAVFSSAF